MKQILKTALASLIALIMSNQMAEAQEVKTEVRNGKNYIVHKVQKGETLFSIAKEYKIETKVIQKINPSAVKLLVGDIVYVPTDEKVEEDVAKATEKTPTLKSTNKLEATSHTSQKGETLFSIAKKYNLSVKELKELNNLESDKLGPGQELIVSTSKRKKEGKLSETKGIATLTKERKEKEVVAQGKKLKGTQTETEEYKIKKGETLYSIAKDNGIKTEELLAMNEDLNEDRIVEGKSILIPSKENVSVVKKPSKEVEKKSEKEPEKIETRKEPAEETPDKEENSPKKPADKPADKIETGGNPFEDAPITLEYAKEKATKGTEKAVKKETKGTEKVVVKETKKIVPEEKVENSKKELPKNSEDPIYHTIKANESFESIRLIYNVSRTELKYWNNYEWDNNKLKVGQQIVVYKPNLVSHTVKAGEKMKDIANKYSVNVRQIEIWNNLQHEQPALVGKTFTIYQPTGPKPDADYLKRKKDIEEQNGKKPEEIVKTNPDLASTATEKETKLIEHLVEKGQGLYSIGKKYKVSTQDIIKWNDLKSDNVQAGKKLKIYTSETEKPSNKATEIDKSKKEEAVVKQDVPVKKDIPVKKDVPVKKDNTTPVVENVKEKNNEQDAFAVNNTENPNNVLRGSGNNEETTDINKKNEVAIPNPNFSGNNQVVTPTDLNTILQTGFAQVIPDIPSPKNQAALHRDIEPGTTLVVKNMQNGKITMVEVAAKLNPMNVAEDVILQVSPSVYQKLGIDGTEKVEVEISYVKKVK
ncbi:MAG: LysM peptidoglycan-binding domain-containing protein [Bacteroidetes bacterium]|nr:MAG: LysM peptidoglycan-binding domain-containing protein [Bacteroidota bacterium]TAG92030.1 MAG: LysM peptidoglycan-binding domain-containing protein [Bacteroidota bacterium]